MSKKERLLSPDPAGHILDTQTNGEQVTQINIIQGRLSTDNSSNTPLLADAVFTGVGEDVVNVGSINIAIATDKDSAVDGFCFQFSTDGTNWDFEEPYTIFAGDAKTYSLQPVAKFFRIVYTNGSETQGVFRLQIVYRAVYVKPSSHRFADNISGQDDSELVKAGITGETPTPGVYKNVKINLEQALSTTDFLFEVARGNVPGMKMYSIHGRKDNINSVPDDITQIPGVTSVPVPGGIQLEAISTDVQDNSGGTGVRSMDIHYLDSSGLEQEETIIMNGTTGVPTVALDIEYVQWIHSKTVGSGGVAVGNISLQIVGGGIVYEYMSLGGNQSLSAKYKVPSDKTGHMVGWQASGIDKKIDLRLRATVERFDRTLIPGVFLFQTNVLLNDATSGWIPFRSPLKMPSNAEIKMSALSVGGGGDAGGQFDILLIDNV